VRFFVYEYLSAGVDATLPVSLRSEGRAMLWAIAEDFVRMAGAEVRTLLHSPLAMPAGCRVECFESGEEEHAFRRLARWADFALVIAPGFDELLGTRCHWVEEENGRLLGPSSQAVALTGDKFALASHLQQQGVRTPSCILVHDAQQPGCSEQPGCWKPSLPDFPLVCKPRFGAGSQATFLVRDPDALPACIEDARAEGWCGEMSVQPFVPGTAASVAFLCGQRRCVELAPAAQSLSADGRFRYAGGELPMPAPQATRAARLARSAVEAVPGIAGYVGVDVVLGEAQDGSADWVIEINPRLTTSYLGLRELAEQNLAEMLARVVSGEAIDPPRWRSGRVRFRSDGTIL
jgi:predicted ATP-grasp superfamily ATP-dependent carboligase